MRKRFILFGSLLSGLRYVLPVGKILQIIKGQLPPAFNRRRCAADWKGNRYSNQKLHERLGWKPRVPMEQAMEAFLSQFESNGNDDPLKS